MVDLLCIAKAFRRAIENSDLTGAPGFLRDFPEGCCGWGTWFVGHYLKYECNMEPERVFGGRSSVGEYEEHEWLELDHVIIDITSDQFPGESQPPVVVSSTSDWHSEWEETKRDQVLEISSYDTSCHISNQKPSELYAQLSAYVRSKCGT
jgi:hypothetical protein